MGVMASFCVAVISDIGSTFRIVGSAETVISNDVESALLLASCTFTLMVNVPASVGVPVMLPLDEIEITSGFTG